MWDVVFDIHMYKLLSTLKEQRLKSMKECEKKAIKREADKSQHQIKVESEQRRIENIRKQRRLRGFYT